MAPEQDRAPIGLYVLMGALLLTGAIDLWFGGYLAALRAALLAAATAVVAATGRSRNRGAVTAIAALIVASLVVSVYSWTRGG